MPRYATGPPPPIALQQHSSGHSRRHRSLPHPHELASRIEEARTSAKLLQQVVQSTPPQQVIGNDLIKDLADRCQAASRSIQGYINCDNPPPDDDTLLTLIETNDQLAASLSKHQRALLQARKALGAATGPSGQKPLLMPRQSGGIFKQSTGDGQPQGPPPRTQPAIFQQNSSYQPPPGPPPQRANNDRTTSSNAPNGIPPAAPAGPPPQLNKTIPRKRLNNPFDQGFETADPSGLAAATPPQDVKGPYHPDFKPTPSYIQRQDSSANNITMHGASPPQPDGNDDMESPDRIERYRF